MHRISNDFKTSILLHLPAHNSDGFTCLSNVVNVLLCMYYCFIHCCYSVACTFDMCFSLNTWYSILLRINWKIQLYHLHCVKSTLLKNSRSLEPRVLWLVGLVKRYVGFLLCSLQSAVVGLNGSISRSVGNADVNETLAYRRTFAVSAQSAVTSQADIML